MQDLNKIDFSHIKTDRILQKEFYQYIHSQLFNIPLRYTKTRDHALEIFNDAMLKIFDKISTEKINNVEGWCAKIIFNSTIDRLRKETSYSNRVVLPENIQEPIIIDDLLNDLEVEDIYKIINKLPAREQQVFSLFEIDGYSHKEIGELLSISNSNSKYLLSMAKRKLREMIFELNLL